MVQGGKDGLVRLLNRQNLSGSGRPGQVGGELQALPSAGCATFTQPLVMVDQSGMPGVILAGTCAMAAYRVAIGAQGQPALQLVWKLPLQTTTPVLAGGVMLAASSGALLALDPASGQQLWSSSMASAGGTIGAIHWESPIVINGRVYCSDEDGMLSAYTLPG